MKAWAKQEAFTLGTNMNAWLFTILRNLYYSQMRKRGREVQDVDGVFTARLGVAPAHDGRMDLADFRRALDGLPADQREAILLIGASGFSYEEAASICGCAVGTVKSRVSRARTRLQADARRFWGGRLRAGRRHQRARRHPRLRERLGGGLGRAVGVRRKTALARSRIRVNLPQQPAGRNEMKWSWKVPQGTAAGLAALAMLAPSAVGSAVKINTTALQDAVTVEGVRQHQAALQEIADANGGTRASGTPGYDASAAYVAEQAEAAGYAVTIQPFVFPFFEELSPAEFEQIAPNPEVYGPDDFAHDGVFGRRQRPPRWRSPWTSRCRRRPPRARPAAARRPISPASRPATSRSSSAGPAPSRRRRSTPKRRARPA